MNTRLQVEHPVTELVTGVDLAAWQIRLAAGEPLAFAQEQLTQRGHAIECRVYAEDPARGFLPSIGEIAYYRRPAGPGVRVDDGIDAGTVVSPYYDPMLLKLITWGADRREAIRKMVRALGDTVILGVTTNIPYLLDVLQHPAFEAGDISTKFLADYYDEWAPLPDTSNSTWLAIAAYEALRGRTKSGRQAVNEGSEPGDADPWQQVGKWRNV
jgi:acetyl/propionyl-CoA carboxylase alpha subunit